MDARTTAAAPQAAPAPTTTAGSTAGRTGQGRGAGRSTPTTAGSTAGRPGQGRGTERLVLAIGEISASYRTVLTPSGSAPVNDVTWTIREDLPARGRLWRRGSSGDASTSLVVLTVTVTGPGWQHVEKIGPATAEEAVAVRARVTQARMLALRSVVWSPATTVQLPPAEAQEGLAAPAR